MSNPSRREVVGILSDRAAFDRAVESLLAAGFERSDLSVLSSHDSLLAADPGTLSWKSRLTGLLGELKYEGPLVTAGLIALAAGEIGALIAALIAAGVGAAAVKELTDEVTADPHSDYFARALGAGSILLWVDVPDPAHEARAKEVLAAAGAGNVHTHERPAAA